MATVLVGEGGHGVQQIIFPFFPNAVRRFTPNTAAFIRLTCRGEGRRRLTLNPPDSGHKAHGEWRGAGGSDGGGAVWERGGRE